MNASVPVAASSTQVPRIWVKASISASVQSASNSSGMLSGVKPSSFWRWSPMVSKSGRGEAFGVGTVEDHERTTLAVEG